jgi:hypothetical protein
MTDPTSGSAKNNKIAMKNQNDFIIRGERSIVDWFLYLPLSRPLPPSLSLLFPLSCLVPLAARQIKVEKKGGGSGEGRIEKEKER